MKLDTKKYQETGTQALGRALSILNSFSQDKVELSLADISKSLSLPKGTVHRLLSSLKHQSFIEQNESNHKYRLGWRLFELGACVDTINILQKKAHPYLEELCEKSKETVHVAVLKEGDIFYIDKNHRGTQNDYRYFRGPETALSHRGSREIFNSFSSRRRT